QLFANPSRALRAIARLARSTLRRESSCVRQSMARDPLLERGFAPRVANFRHFALTTRGLTIGFPIGQVALGICNRVQTTFPYAVDINDKPASPWTRVPALHDLPPVTQEYAIDKPKPPKGTSNTLLILGADGPLGRDEFLRLLYGGQESLEVALGATLLALVL